MDTIKKKFQENNIPYEENVSLKKKTWIKTGGIASLWIAPTSLKALKNAIEILCFAQVEFELVGHTSNLYYLDDYNPTVVLSTINVKQFKETEEYIECACGVPVTTLSRYCVDKGYVGYSGLVNLPGTVGAAIYNNSSCFECSISEHLLEATFYDLKRNEIVILKPYDLNFTYRNSILKRKLRKGILLTLKLSKKQGNVKEEKIKALEATRIRKTTQEPPAYTLGSVYAGLIPKKNLQFRLAKVWGKILNLSRLYTKKRYIMFLLDLYGFSDIKDFVSERVINTFKWLPNREDKHEKFQRYQTFIAKAYKEPRLEIEIRNGSK